MRLYLKKRIENNVFRFLAKKPELSSKVLKTITKRRKRNVQIFCVGLPRSGTHSLANLFGGNFRSRHEPLVGPTVKFCMRFAKIKYPGDRGSKYVNDERLLFEPRGRSCTLSIYVSSKFNRPFSCSKIYFIGT
jgi:hypothetical protein